MHIYLYMYALVQTAIVAGGGVEVIVAAMRTHAAVPAVGEKGCLALGHLALEHAGAQVGVGWRRAAVGEGEPARESRV